MPTDQKTETVQGFLGSRQRGRPLRRGDALFRLRWIRLGVGAVAVAAAAIVTTDRFNVFEVRRLESQITDLQRQKAEMLLYAQRLSASRRLAQVNVVEQHRDEAGGLITVLRWQQIGRSGALGSPEIIEVKGGQVYFEAMVIRFMLSPSLC